MTNATESLTGTLAKTRGQQLRIPLVLSCAMLIGGIDQTALAASIPQMAQSLGESPIRLNCAITCDCLDGDAQSPVGAARQAEVLAVRSA